MTGLRAGDNVADVVEELRGKITRITGEPGPLPRDPVRRDGDGAGGPRTAGPAGVPVPSWLGRNLVAGALPRGAVTAAADCPAALVDVLSTLTAGGGCAAVVGYPRLALAAVAAGGGDLERLVVVPDPTPHATAVLGTLVEGLDLVLYAAPATVSPTAARPVEARLRRSDCALLVCSPAMPAAGVRSWPNARLHLDWRAEGVTGLGAGSGRVRGVTVAGRAWGQGQPPQSFRELVGGRGSAGTGAAVVQELAQ
ncbi:hypothetical protein [Corynebacterium sp.]|uniref:hypothetical protein n=1 Tax=Corynebacterium sp. TaxID=1720 RepID=UPI003F9DFDEE